VEWFGFICTVEVDCLELPCASWPPKLFGLCGLRTAAQFLWESLCNLHFGTVQPAQVVRHLLHQLWCKGDGGGVPYRS
jgi:hypothetical protein